MQGGLATFLEGILGASTPSGDHYRMFQCPFHKQGKERNASFAVNVSTGGAICHACKVTFSGLKYLLEALGIREDREYLEQMFDLGKPVRRPPVRLTPIPEELLAPMAPPYDKIRGFPEHVLDHYEVRYDSKKDALVYPLRNGNGELVRIHYRMLSPGSKMRYVFATREDYAAWGLTMDGEEPVGKGGNFLGGHFVLPVLRDSDVPVPVCLVEGPKQMMRVYQAGFQMVMATMGGLTSDQATELQNYEATVLLLFDNDDPGQLSAQSAFKKLSGAHRVRIVSYRGIRKRQPDDLSLSEVRYLLSSIGG